MQVLVQTSPLRTFFLHGGYETILSDRRRFLHDIPVDEIETVFIRKEGKGRGSLTSSLQSFMLKMWEEKDHSNQVSAYSPNGLFASMCGYHSSFRSFRQQDAHELLRAMFDSVLSEERKRLYGSRKSGEIVHSPRINSSSESTIESSENSLTIPSHSAPSTDTSLSSQANKRKRKSPNKERPKAERKSSFLAKISNLFSSRDGNTSEGQAEESGRKQLANSRTTNVQTTAIPFTASDKNEEKGAIENEEVDEVCICIVVNEKHTEKNEILIDYIAILI